MNRERIVVVGWSRAGSAVARALERSGSAIVGVWNRTSPVDPHSLAGRPERRSLGALAADRPTCVILGVADDALRPLAVSVAASLGDCAGIMALHLSGSLDVTPLAAVSSAGGQVGSIHPLKSFAALAIDDRALEGVTCAVEGSPAVCGRIEPLLRAAGGRPVTVDSARKADWHLAAALASNVVLSVFDWAVRRMTVAGIPPERAAEILLPLTVGTLTNAGRLGAPSALTGPVARGDTEVLCRHLAALADAPNERRLYVETLRMTLELARRGYPNRTASHDALDRWLDSLDDDGRRP